LRTDKKSEEDPETYYPSGGVFCNSNLCCSCDWNSYVSWRVSHHFSKAGFSFGGVPDALIKKVFDFKSKKAYIIIVINEKENLGFRILEN